MNIRMPDPISDVFLKVQDEYLKAENEAAGTVRIEDITPVGSDERIYLWQGDMSRLAVDAVVNPANSGFTGCYQWLHSCLDNILGSKAGIQLRLCCNDIIRKQGHPEPTGQAKITPAFNLPAKYIIHTVGPIWNGGGSGEDTLLEDCYRNSLKTALKLKCDTVAFPLISSGAYGYPKDKALKTAIAVISSFLFENEMTVYLVIFDNAAYQISEKLFSGIASYIDDNYVLEHSDKRSGRARLFSQSAPSFQKYETYEYLSVPSCTLSDALSQIDESFSQMLMRKIDEKGMTDAECYKKANIDRKLFSKIRSDIHYRPSKTTAIAFAISLELSLAETAELLMKAGFALSHSNKFDIIIEYFIKNGNYNVFEINEALFAFDQNLLGC
jgi:O-acetyl-ADP-ribose deacetylase (regulator of RNase III)